MRDFAIGLIVAEAMKAMKAIRVLSFGGPEVLKLVSDVPVPTVSSGQVRRLFLPLISISLSQRT